MEIEEFWLELPQNSSFPIYLFQQPNQCSKNQEDTYYYNQA